MLINISNRACDKWSEKQLQAASEFGQIVDIPFPTIDPYADSEAIDDLVKETKYDAPRGVSKSSI